MTYSIQDLESYINSRIGENENFEGLTDHLQQFKGSGEIAQKINDKLANGLTPLQMAAAIGDGALVENLLHVNGIDINNQGENGWTALHYAAYRFVPENNSQNPRAEIPSRDQIKQFCLQDESLIMAPKSPRENGNQLDVISELVRGEGGADIEIRDNYGLTAEDIMLKTKQHQAFESKARNPINKLKGIEVSESDVELSDSEDLLPSAPEDRDNYYPYLQKLFLLNRDPENSAFTRFGNKREKGQITNGQEFSDCRDLKSSSESPKSPKKKLKTNQEKPTANEPQICTSQFSPASLSIIEGLVSVAKLSHDKSHKVASGQNFSEEDLSIIAGLVDVAKRDFESPEAGSRILYKDINNKFYEAFLPYLNQKKSGESLSDSSNAQSISSLDDQSTIEQKKLFNPLNFQTPRPSPVAPSSTPNNGLFRS